MKTNTHKIPPYVLGHLCKREELFWNGLERMHAKVIMMVASGKGNGDNRQRDFKKNL